MNKKHKYSTNTAHSSNGKCGLSTFLFGFEIMQNSFQNPTNPIGLSAIVSVATAAAATSSRFGCYSATWSTVWDWLAKLPPIKYSHH